MADAKNENQSENIDTIINDLTERKNGTQNLTHKKVLFHWAIAFALVRLAFECH